MRGTAGRKKGGTSRSVRGGEAVTFMLRTEESRGRPSNGGLLQKREYHLKGKKLLKTAFGKISLGRKEEAYPQRDGREAMGKVLQGSVVLKKIN